jgi:hypothetical protein
MVAFTNSMLMLTRPPLSKLSPIKKICMRFSLPNDAKLSGHPETFYDERFYMPSERHYDRKVSGLKGKGATLRFGPNSPLNSRTMTFSVPSQPALSFELWNTPMERPRNFI